MLSWRSARGRAILAGVVFMLLLAFVAAVAVWRAHDDQRRNEALERRSRVVAALEDARAQLFLASTWVAASAIAEDPAVLYDLNRQAEQASRESLAQARAELIALGEADELARLEEAASQIDELVEGADVAWEFFLAADEDARVEGAREHLEPLWPLAWDVIGGVEELAEGHQDRLAAERAAADRAADVTLLLLVGASALAFVAGVGAVFGLVVSALRPLASLRASVRAITSGNLEARAKVSGPEEVASLAWDFNQMVTERQRAETDLRRLSRQNELVLNAAGEGIYGLDLQGRTTFANPAAARMIGWEVEDLIGQAEHEVLHHSKPDGSAYPREECPIYAALKDGSVHHVTDDVFWRKDGTSFPIEYISTPIRDECDEVVGAVVTFKDITERKRFEALLVHLANRDPLMDLFNRRRFQEELERGLAEAQRYGTRGALLLVDLDNFKDVNDSLGHRAGDELLTEVGIVLQERLRETDIIARLGGDEFAILLAHTSGDEAQIVTGQLLETVERHPFEAGGQPITATASAGIALVPAHGETAEELLARADLAMYQAKESGRNTYRAYAPEGDWQAQIESRLGWQSRLREALEKDLFLLYAQPILDLRRDGISQYELLLRLGGGETIVTAESFIDIAERFGLIQAIDRWVVRQGIALLAEHQGAGRDLRLEVNLSGKAFGDSELLPLIRHELEATSVDPASLVLEVTETAAIANIREAQKFVRTLKDLGCRFALDDFGVGFSSFYHLKHLPVDFLKIDGSFIRELPSSPVDQQLVQAIVQVARGLGKQTIAEFVGSDETLRLLREYGVDYGQGYHIGQPGEVSKVLPDARPDMRRAA